MKKIISSIFLSLIVMSLSSCSTSDSENSSSPEVSGIELTSPTGVIFSESSFSQGAKYFTGVGEMQGVWQPSVDEVKSADEIAGECIKTKKEEIVEEKVRDYSGDSVESEKDFYQRVLTKIEPVYSDYFRQYIGYEGEDHQKYIRINYFLPEEAVKASEMGIDWKKSIIAPPNTTIRSDYHGFFEVLIDLDQKECVYFKLGV